MNPDQSPRSNGAAPKPARTPVKLADEPDFALSGMTVRPSLREISGQDWSETLEPRVMEVLVVLAGAQGAVVSREELIARCWSGRAVSDDAVERCIARLRKLRERAGGAVFAIETVPRVGYRLMDATTADGAARGATASDRETRSRVLSRSRWWPYALVLLVLGSVASWFWLRESPRWSVVSLTMLTTPPTEAFAPAISPNGATIAYAAEDGDHVRHIFVRNLASGDPLQLTNDLANDSSPAWSPRGDRFAFARRRDNQPCEILIKDVPAGRQTSIGRCRFDETTQIAWSPAGRLLYYSDREGRLSPDRIVSLDLQTGERRFVTAPQPRLLGDFSPVVSPDGTRMAFERLDSGDLLVFVVDLDTGRETQIGGRESDARGMAWSSDGDTLFVALERPSGSAIWGFPSRGGKPVRLTLDSLEYGLLAQGPGAILGFESRNERFSAAAPSAAPTAIQSAPPAGVQHGLPDQLDIAKDGSYVASVGNEGDESLWIKHPGRMWRRLEKTSAVALFNPRWSPDGKTIAFEGSLATGQGLFVVSAENGNPRLTVPIDINLVNPAIWSADGTSLIYPVLDAHGWRLWKADIARHAPPMAISDWGWCSVREFDGALYGSRVDRAGIWKISTPPLPVVAALPPDRCYDWSMAAGRVVYLDRTNPNLLKFVVHPLSGGPDSILLAPGMPIDDAGSTPFGLRPDTGEVEYLRMWNENSIGVLKLSRTQ